MPATATEGVDGGGALTDEQRVGEAVRDLGEADGGIEE